MRQESLNSVGSVHRENLRRNLQRRIEAARAQGNEQLVRQLESEADYIG